MSSCDSSDDLLSMLKEAEEKEDGDFEISTFQIVDFFFHLLFVVLETTPKTIALVVKRLSENPHIIQELRVNIFYCKSVFVCHRLTNLNN